MLDTKKVVLGISGGVDSALSAKLLQLQGLEVFPVFLKVHDCDNVDKSLSDAKKVCDFLGISIIVADIRKRFLNTIINPFMQMYLDGSTPNPCVYCNYLIKWQILKEYADSLNAEHIATGHYSKILKLPNGRYTIQRISKNKDQSYVMYHLSQEILSRIYFPLSEYEKPVVRKMANDYKIPVANKQDSQEICFVDDDYAKFIEDRLTDKSDIKYGNFILQDGTVLGRHKGIHRYTIGQRKGLGIAYKHSLFVLGLADNKTDIVLGINDDLFTNELIVDNINLMAVDDIQDGMVVEAAIRYGHRGAKAKLYQLSDDELKCIFDEPQRAITKGQAAVFYRDDYIVAGGIIK